jgi:uncharacterized repeat protein (TIGR01451 family)
MGKRVYPPGLVRSGDTLQYTVGVTVVGNAAQAVVVTDTMPVGTTYQATQGAPSFASFSQVGQTLTWTIGSLAAGTYQWTYTARVDDFQIGGTVLTNGVTLTQAGPTLGASVSVTVRGDYQVRVAVYNEAGEVVKEILVREYSQPILDITLITDRMIDSLNDQVDIYYQGYLIGEWDGTNWSGDPAPNGIYHVKVDNVDTMGSVTTATQQAIVSRSIHRTEVTIYNSAGEAVRHLYEVLSDPGPDGLSGVTLTSAVIQPGAQGGTIPTQLGVLLSGGTTVIWDGRSDNGSVVTTGQYFVEVHVADGQGGDQQITHAVLVDGDKGQMGAGVVTAMPNALSATAPTAIFNATGAGVTTLKVRIYTTAGELVEDQLQGPSGVVSWTPDNIASGLYLAVVEVSDAKGLLSTKVLKISVKF